MRHGPATHEAQPARRRIDELAPRSAHQLLDFGSLALLGVGGIGVAAVDALLAEAGPLPDQVIDGTLQLGDAIFEITN